MKKITPTPLSRRQLEIMEIVWEHGELSAIEIRDVLSKSRDISRNAVKTYIERIEAKGWLTHRVVGRTHFYSAIVNQDQGLSNRIAELVDKVCGGDPGKLMLALLSSRKLSKKEFDKIEKILADAKDESNQKPSRKGRRS